MRIAIIGHGHLAYITAACMEQFHSVTVDARAAGDVDLVWICHDTPVDKNGVPDHGEVIRCIEDKINECEELLNYKVILISSQIAVGTCKYLSKKYPSIHFAYSPENLRRGKAINDFMHPERIIIGCDINCEYVKNTLEELFKPLSPVPIFWTWPESAEMIKHALNSFLATSIAFINEISKVCDAVGANPNDVAYGLQSDKRVGFLSYLKPGGPYTNDTLGREIHTLIELDNKLNLGLNLIPAVKKSNDAHRNNR